MAPRTRSYGAPAVEHQQPAPVTPKKSLKRNREDESDSDRESKRPQTAPHRSSATGTRLFERGTSFVALNRARRQRLALTPPAQRMDGRSLAVPASTGRLDEQRARPAAEEQESESQPEQPRQSTVSWLMGIPSRLFSPSKPSTPPVSSQPRKTGEPREPSPPLVGLELATLVLPPKPAEPPLTPIEKARKDLRLKRYLLQRKKQVGKDSARRIELLEQKFAAEEREIEALEQEELAARKEELAAREEDFATEEVAGSKKRKLSSNTYALIYSDEEEVDDDNDSNANRGGSETSSSPCTAEKAPTATATPNHKNPNTPLKSAFRNVQSGPTNKKLRIAETPPLVKKLYGHYGPAGEYTGSTFADKSRNSFSSFEEESIRTQSSDDSSVPTDARGVRHKILSPNTRINSHINSMPASAQEKLPEEMGNPFRSIIKDNKAVQPNSFRVPYLDEPSDDEDQGDNKVEGHAQQGHNASTTDTATDITPATPKMSHAELPEAQSSAPLSGRPTDEDARNKESEEAALKKVREAAQKYKPKTSSRLSTFEQKTQASPPSAINKEAREQQKSGQGPYSPPYTWTRPPKGSYSTEAPGYEPRSYDDTHVGPDGMTDKQRYAARDADADAWVAGNVKWPEPPTYVEAGLCSNYIDGLIKTEVCLEGRERTDKIMGQQFEEILKWVYEEKAKGNQCALTWNNAREELVW